MLFGENIELESFFNVVILSCFLFLDTLDALTLVSHSAGFAFHCNVAGVKKKKGAPILLPFRLHTGRADVVLGLTGNCWTIRNHHTALLPHTREKEFSLRLFI